MLERAAAELIDRFGETVTIVPAEGDTHTSDDVWVSTNSFDTASSYDIQARVLRGTTLLEQMERGLSDEAEAAFYFTDEEVSIGDKIEVFDEEWVVKQTEVNRIGNGNYRQVATVVSPDQ